MRKQLIICSIAIVTGFSSCKEKKEEKIITVEQNHHEEPMDHNKEKNHDNMHHEETAALSFSDPKIANVYGHYIHIKKALVFTEAKEAKSGAKMLVKALSEVPNNEAALKEAKKIEASGDIEVQRVAFSPLSAEINKLIEGKITSGAVYKQYCPMAFDFKGAYWLSSESEIKNPYFGDKMLNCGEVKDTIQ
ncbi:DUF3347 domain-containing protein [Leptobacterium sp. I13]|uniref:DUF3347 domain-containing protein n=1 Tax=Leptobacterium meishanense TaxID=3128904 RepID=UPI0030EDE7A8